MPKATFSLPNGTMVTIDGSTEEVQRLLSVYAGQTNTSPQTRQQPRQSKVPRRRAAKNTSVAAESERVEASTIVNLIKTCDEAEAIEKHILDHDSLVDRTLLPLYIVYGYLENGVGLTSGDIHRITRDLGSPVRQSHASTTLSTTAARYVIGDKVRQKGVAVRYKLSRRGHEYMKSVIAPAPTT